MTVFEKKLLNALIDSYERSSLSRGVNKVAVRIYYHFTKKNVPEYFDESSMAYEDIHAILLQLETWGWIEIWWKDKKAGHIVDKVSLVEEKIPDIYDFLKRVPESDQKKKTLEVLNVLLKQYENVENAPATTGFLKTMIERIEKDKSVKEYIDLADTKATRSLVETIVNVELNQKECFIREFSIEHFHDSKQFEHICGKVCKIIREYVSEYTDLENNEILSEYQIYQVPGYVYLKGDVIIELNGQQLDLGMMKNGIAFSPDKELLESFKILETSKKIKTVYTIENLTSFFRFNKENSLIVYLGGYHNQIRRQMLQQIFSELPKAFYYHFGDIDAGGFLIYHHLKEKTGIPFVLYGMNIQVLKAYGQYGRKLTDNDVKRLKMIAQKETEEDILKTIDYMLTHNVKLEQECLENME